MEFVRWQMQMERNLIACPLLCSPAKPGNLQWTGNVVEWVELIYALYAAGKINDGQTSLKELFLQMGEIFGIEVKEFAVYFMNIKNRTDGHRTKFMDFLRNAVLEKMKESDRKPSRK
jgi:hypothetical protein